MAVTFTINLKKEVSLEDHIIKTYGNQKFQLVATKEYETTIYYTVESFYGLVFNAFVEYGGFDRDIPYVVAHAKAANGNFVQVIANMVSENGREHYQYNIDAPETFKQEYKEYQLYKLRKANIQKQLRDRKYMMETAKNIGAPNYIIVKKLRKAAEQNGDFNEVVKLMKSFKKGTIRSEFRQSLAIQIFNWMNDPAPTYKSPLSPKQFSYLRPYKAY